MGLSCWAYCIDYSHPIQMGCLWVHYCSIQLALYVYMLSLVIMILSARDLFPSVLVLYKTWAHVEPENESACNLLPLPAALRAQ